MSTQLTPVDIYFEKYASKGEVEHVEEQAKTVTNLPTRTKLGDLKTPVYGADPTELIADRFLYRGGIMLLVGPTGVGKSSFTMQLMIHFAIGRGLFQINPGSCYTSTGMRILLVQAENDEGDLAEMRDGVLRGCDDLTLEEKAKAMEQVDVVTVCDQAGDVFVNTLDGLLTDGGPYDLLVADPAFAYLGGDSNSQKDVSYFMRQLLNPLVQKHNVGMMLDHHTNKPPKGKEKDDWQAGDFAYLGSGSAEWINPARAALAIRSLGDNHVFELRAAKRWRRLKWQDEEGLYTAKQYIQHSEDPNLIHWEVADPAAVAELTEKKGTGRPRKCSLVELVHGLLHFPGMGQTKFSRTVAKGLGCSPGAVINALEVAEEADLVSHKMHGQSKVYTPTRDGERKAKNTPSGVDWKGLE